MQRACAWGRQAGRYQQHKQGEHPTRFTRIGRPPWQVKVRAKGCGCQRCLLSLSSIHLRATRCRKKMSCMSRLTQRGRLRFKRAQVSKACTETVSVMRLLGAGYRKPADLVWEKREPHAMHRLQAQGAEAPGATKANAGILQCLCACTSHTSGQRAHRCCESR